MSSQPAARLSVAEYLEIERAAEGRSEYLQGQMYAMSGASFTHSRIVSAAVAALYGQLRGKDCSVVSTDLRVFIPVFDVLTYPDIVVSCGPPVLLDNRRDTLLDATVLAEVLSPSTANYDMGEKFRYYRALPSLTDYVLIAQDAVRVQHHNRQPDGSWLMREFGALTDEIELAAIGCRLRIADLYERVEFPAAD